MEHIEKSELENIVNNTFESIESAVDTLAQYLSSTILDIDVCHHGVSDLTSIVLEKITDRMLEIIPEDKQKEYSRMVLLETLFKAGVLDDTDHSDTTIHIYS